MQFNTANEEETAACAAKLAKGLAPGAVLLLRGMLGAGKSVFARALIRVLAADPHLDVPSPTFTLVQTYDTPRGTVWHFDLYRLKSPEEIFELGWEEALADGIVIVEWPERLGSFAPAQALRIQIDGEGNERRVLIDGAV